MGVLAQNGVRVKFGTPWALRERLGWKAPLGRVVRGSDQRRPIWLHGASLGEVKGVLELLDFWGANGGPYLVTTQKAEVRQWLREKRPDVLCAMAPLNSAGAVRRFLQLWRPRALVLYEGEIWPAWLRGAQEAQIATALVSARLGSGPRRWWSLWLGLMRPSLARLQWVSCATVEVARRLGPHIQGTLRVGCDWKLLGFAGATAELPDFLQSREPPPHRIWQWAVVSAHGAEWPRLQGGLLNALAQGDAVVLLPRVLGELPRWRRLLARAEIPVVPWPAAQKGSVTLVEGWGCVPAALAQSQRAIIGGSFCSVGVHNYWEALAADVPCVVGPWAAGQEAHLRALQRAGWVQRAPNWEAVFGVGGGPEAGGGYAWVPPKGRGRDLLQHRAVRARACAVELGKWLENEGCRRSLNRDHS